VFFGYINNNVDLMSRKQTPIITYKGRSLGIAVLTVAQLFIGAIHVFFGLLLLVFENISFLQATAAYDVYTFTFGLLALVFAVFSGRAKSGVGLALLRFLCLLLLRIP
jgi:hypothetical protein